MTLPRSGSPLPPLADVKPIPDWKLKDYGNGPEPARDSPEWMSWIEEQSISAAIAEAADEAVTSEEGAPEAPLVSQQNANASESSEPPKKDWKQVLEDATPEDWTKARKVAEETLIRRAGKTVQVFPVND